MSHKGKDSGNSHPDVRTESAALGSAAIPPAKGVTIPPPPFNKIKFTIPDRPAGAPAGEPFVMGLQLANGHVMQVHSPQDANPGDETDLIVPVPDFSAQTSRIGIRLAAFLPKYLPLMDVFLGGAVCMTGLFSDDNVHIVDSSPWPKSGVAGAARPLFACFICLSALIFKLILPAAEAHASRLCYGNRYRFEGC